MSRFVMADTTQLAYIKETEWGVTPTSPQMQILRMTGESLTYNPQTVTSQELSPDRNIKDQILASAGTSGGVNFELSYATYDDLLESLFYNKWDNNALVNGLAEQSLTLEKRFYRGMSEGDKPIYDYFRFKGMIANTMSLNIQAGAVLTGSFEFMGKGAETFTETEMAANVAAILDDEGEMYNKKRNELINDNVKILDDGSVVGDFVYVADYTGFDSTHPELQKGWYFPLKLGEKYKGKTIKVQRTSGEGGTEASSTDLNWILRLHDGKDTVYSIKAEGVEDLTLNFAKAVLGSEAEHQDAAVQLPGVKPASQEGATYKEATTEDILSASHNVGTLTMQGFTSPKLASVSLNITNNLQGANIVGSHEYADIGAGTFMVSGTIEAFYDNLAMYKAFLDGTASSLSLTVGKTSGHKYKFEIPKMKFSSGEIVAGGQNQYVMARMNFQGVYDTGIKGTMKITRAVTD